MVPAARGGAPLGEPAGPGSPPESCSRNHSNGPATWQTTRRKSPLGSHVSWHLTRHGEPAVRKRGTAVLTPNSLALGFKPRDAAARGGAGRARHGARGRGSGEPLPSAPHSASLAHASPVRHPGGPPALWQWREHLGGRGRPLSRARARGVRLSRVSVRGGGRRAARRPGPLGSPAAARAREGRRARAGLFAPRRPARQQEQRQQEDDSEPRAGSASRHYRGRSHVVPRAM